MKKLLLPTFLILCLYGYGQNTKTATATVHIVKKPGIYIGPTRNNIIPKKISKTRFFISEQIFTLNSGCDTSSTQEITLIGAAPSFDYIYNSTKKWVYPNIITSFRIIRLEEITERDTVYWRHKTDKFTSCEKITTP